MNTSFKKSVIAIVLAMIFTGCHAPHDHKISGHNPVHVDSLFELTGNAQLDSLLQLAATSPQDTNLVRLYSQIGDMYKNNDPEKAKAYYLKVGRLSETLDWNRGRYWYAVDFSNMLNREGVVDSAIAIIQEALALAVRENDESQQANMLANLGNSYYNKEWYETALNYYMLALPFLEKENNTRKLQLTYYMMCQIYRDIGAIEKTIEYGEKSVALNRESPEALFILASAYSVAHAYEKAASYYQEALHLCESQKNIYVMATIYYHLGDDAMMAFDLDKAEKYALRSLEIRRQYGIEDYCLNYMLLGKIEQLKGHYAPSETYIKKALQIAIENEDPEAERVCYSILAELAIALHKYHENIQYWEKRDLTAIEIATNTALRASEEMAAKYETEKKEIRITALEEEKRLMKWLGITGGAVLLLTLAVFLFLWRMTMQRKRVVEQQKRLVEQEKHIVEQEKNLMEQQVKQLEQEKQLIATQSLIDGETQERSRLARDLHDGLGSILTGTRLNLLEMKKDVVMTPEMQERYNTAYTLLNESIREMRRVAHHLMPEALSAAGLKQAAADFCNSIPQATFLYMGDETRFDARREIVVYRIMHELVNNALKHSGATHILVQIMHENGVVALTVQDNGCGFDPATAAQGMGLTNIRMRVAAFNGNLMIDSKPGVGTEINVEFNG